MSEMKHVIILGPKITYIIKNLNSFITKQMRHIVPLIQKTHVHKYPLAVFSSYMMHLKRQLIFYDVA